MSRLDRPRRGTLVVTLVALFAAAVLTGCSSTSPARASARPQSLEEQWGVHLLGIRHSAGGYMLDFRYRVLDAAKAGPLLKRGIKPYLIDEATGATLRVPEPPKLGSLRNTGTPVAGKNYFVIFGNPGKFVKPGSRVTVVIGEFRAPNLVVE